MREELVRTSQVIEHTLDTSALIDFGKEACFDKEFPTPEVLGRGSIRVIRVSENVGYYFIRHEAIMDFVTTLTEFNDDMIKLAWIFSIGDSTAGIEGLSKRIAANPGFMLMSSPKAKNIFIDSPQVPALLANMVIRPQCVADCLEQYEAGFSVESSRMIREPGGELSLYSAPFDNRARLAIKQVERCPFGGSLQRLYLEGKAFELAALAFSSLQGPRPHHRRPLGPKDRARMIRIRDYIDTNFCLPLSLGQIAATIGVSTAKLKRDYKRMFGRGIHQDIVARRMELAYKLITDDGMSVKEAAYLCGYKSVAHFSASFRQRFGRSPGALN